MGKKCALCNYPVSGIQIEGKERRDASRKKRRGGGVGGERFPPLSLSLTSLFYLPVSYFLLHSTIWTPGTGYKLYNQTASYTGFQRSRLNELKNFLLLLQIAINTETYVTTSTTILNSFHSVYIHLLKCPPQSHCPPLFSLQDMWHSFQL